MSSHHVVALRGAVVASAWQTWAPVASVVIASLSFLIAWANRRTSKKALELSTAQEDRRKARLDLNLNQAIARRTAGVAQRLICVDVLAVNPTDRDGSVVTADLNVTYRKPGSDGIVVKIPHDVSADPKLSSIPAFVLPCPLPANGAVRGWLVFLIDDRVLDGGIIEHYDVVVRDGRGITASVQPWALQEITDEAPQD